MYIAEANKVLAEYMYKIYKSKYFNSNNNFNKLSIRVKFNFSNISSSPSDSGLERLGIESSLNYDKAGSGFESNEFSSPDSINNFSSFGDNNFSGSGNSNRSSNGLDNFSSFNSFSNPNLNSPGSSSSFRSGSGSSSSNLIVVEVDFPLSFLFFWWRSKPLVPL